MVKKLKIIYNNKNKKYNTRGGALTTKLALVASVGSTGDVPFVINPYVDPSSNQQLYNRFDDRYGNVKSTFIKNVLEDSLKKDGVEKEELKYMAKNKSDADITKEKLKEAGVDEQTFIQTLLDNGVTKITSTMLDNVDEWNAWVLGQGDIATNNLNTEIFKNNDFNLQYLDKENKGLDFLEQTKELAKDDKNIRKVRKRMRDNKIIISTDLTDSMKDVNKQLVLFNENIESGGIAHTDYEQKSLPIDVTYGNYTKILNLENDQLTDSDLKIIEQYNNLKDKILGNYTYNEFIESNAKENITVILPGNEDLQDKINKDIYHRYLQLLIKDDNTKVKNIYVPNFDINNNKDPEENDIVNSFIRKSLLITSPENDTTKDINDKIVRYAFNLKEGWKPLENENNIEKEFSAITSYVNKNWNLFEKNFPTNQTKFYITNESKVIVFTNKIFPHLVGDKRNQSKSLLNRYYATQELKEKDQSKPIGDYFEKSERSNLTTNEYDKINKFYNNSEVKTEFLEKLVPVKSFNNSKKIEENLEKVYNLEDLSKVQTSLKNYSYLANFMKVYGLNPTIVNGDFVDYLNQYEKSSKAVVVYNNKYFDKINEFDDETKIGNEDDYFDYIKNLLNNTKLDAGVMKVITKSLEFIAKLRKLYGKKLPRNIILSLLPLPAVIIAILGKYKDKKKTESTTASNPVSTTASTSASTSAPVISYDNIITNSEITEEIKESIKKMFKSNELQETPTINDSDDEIEINITLKEDYDAKNDLTYKNTIYEKLAEIGISKDVIDSIEIKSGSTKIIIKINKKKILLKKMLKNDKVQLFIETFGRLGMYNYIDHNLYQFLLENKIVTNYNNSNVPTFIGSKNKVNQNMNLIIELLFGLANYKNLSADSNSFLFVRVF